MCGHRHTAVLGAPARSRRPVSAARVSGGEKKPKPYRILFVIFSFLRMFSSMVWKKYKNHNTNNGYDNNGLRREDSCDAVKSSSFMQSAEEVTIYRVSLTYYFVWLFSPRLCRE